MGQSESLLNTCTGRFHPLKKYFEDIYVEDLNLLEEADFLDAAEPQHKLLMRVFLHEHNFFATNNPPYIKRYDIFLSNI